MRPGAGFRPGIVSDISARIESRDVLALYPGEKAVKLTRKAIAEGLDQVPIDAVILGAANSKEQRLTAKQREFARQIALGETKAGAYRKAYKSKGKPETASKRGQELAKTGIVSAQIEAFRLAIEAERSRTPAHLRALVVHKLTEKAIDPGIPPAQQIKALELLGKITEVALFTERREVIQVKDSGEIRARLIESIRAAIKNSAEDAKVKDADLLLAEISGTIDAQPADSHISSDNVTDATDGAAVEIPAAATPPVGDPPNPDDSHTPIVHSIPHTESQTLSHAESTLIASPTLWTEVKK